MAERGFWRNGWTGLMQHRIVEVLAPAPQMGKQIRSLQRFHTAAISESWSPLLCLQIP
uniref:Uncharacterized protein n=1 Tax=Oryza brachyantha TaxID=4533 RepID=J3N0R0_ORYBR